MRNIWDNVDTYFKQLRTPISLLRYKRATNEKFNHCQGYNISNCLIFIFPYEFEEKHQLRGNVNESPVCAIWLPFLWLCPCLKCLLTVDCNEPGLRWGETTHVDPEEGTRWRDALGPSAAGQQTASVSCLHMLPPATARTTWFLRWRLPASTLYRTPCLHADRLGLSLPCGRGMQRWFN